MFNTAPVRWRAFFAAPDGKKCVHGLGPELFSRRLEDGSSGLCLLRWRCIFGDVMRSTVPPPALASALLGSREAAITYGLMAAGVRDGI
jgi:hypothetical protein